MTGSTGGAGHRAAIAAAFFASGVAGLVYQAIWVRAFGNVFGHTVHSAGVVTALFMGGLGLGSWRFGRYADRIASSPDAAARLYRLYAHLEVAIGLFGALIALVLPMLEPLSAWASGYTQGDDGFFRPTLATHVVRYGAAALLLLPSTVCMGGTLTVLVRALVRVDPRDAGPRLSWLYGINTLGAAVGAFGVDALSVPILGLRGTQGVAALLNLTVALVALGWARRAPTAVPTGAPPGDGAQSSRGLLGAALALGLSGLAGMGLEVLWFRMLGAALGSHRSTFSLLLAVLLTGLFLGATLGSAITRRLGRSAAPARALAQVFAGAQGLVVAAALLCMSGYDLSQYLDADLVLRHASGTEGGRRLLEAWMSLRPMLGVVLAPAVLMGLAYPLANAAVQEVLGEVGVRAGVLYLANTVGGIIGSLISAFVLVPVLGMQATAAVLGGVALAAGVPLLWTTRGLTPRGRAPLAAVAAGVGLGAAALIAFVSLPTGHLLSRIATVLITRERVLALSEGPSEIIAVSQDDASGARTLWTNGHPMTGTHYMAQRYMRAFVHVPLLMHPAPRRALVICFGVGNTVHAASLYPELESIEVADLSEHVLHHASYFQEWNHGVLSDPRVHVHINDGRQHLRTLPRGSLDLVTLEPPPLTHAGVSSLYSREFYQLVRSRLAPGGYLTQWLPIYQVPGDVAVSMVRAFIEAFPNGALLSGYGRELILIGRAEGRVVFDPDLVGQRLAAHPAVRADLERIDLARLTDLVTTLAGSSERMNALSAGIRSLTDDEPLLEYSPDKLPEAVIPGDLFGPDELAVWCPKCELPRADLPHLAAIVALNRALYHSEAFRVVARTRGPIKTSFPVRGVSPEDARVAWQSSGYLRRLIPESALPR